MEFGCQLNYNLSQVKGVFLLKKLTALLLLLSVCVLQGCGSKQLNERMVIQGIGIDYTDSEYKVTVMYMNTDVNEQDTTYKTVVGKGRTVTEAVTSTVSQNGLEPLYSHNSFILLGKSICNEGVTEPLEFFAGYYQCRPSVNVLVADTEANEIMTLPKITPHTISEIAESKNTTGRTLTSPMYIFLSDIINNTSSACTAFITVQNDMPKAKGMAVFDGDKLNFTLNETESMGVMLTRGESDISAEVIPLGGKNKSFALSHESTETYVYIEKGKLYCNVEIKGKATVYEYTDTANGIEDEVEKRINKITQNAITACAEKGSDVFYFGKILRQSDYEVYNTIDDWNKLIRNGVYTVTSDISVK